MVVLGIGGKTAFVGARKRMVDGLRERGIVESSVLRALSEVPRHEFVEEALRDRAYEDHSLPIGHGQTISHPSTVALMTEALELTGSERVLEVGTGSGYQTAVLSRLCSNVYTVERLSPLAARARRILDRLGCYNVALQIGDGTIGWRSEAPFDAIIVTAATPTFPRALLGQLRADGRLVVPMGGEEAQTLVRYWIDSAGVVTEELIGDCRFVKCLGKYGFAR